MLQHVVLNTGRIETPDSVQAGLKIDAGFLTRRQFSDQHILIVAHLDLGQPRTDLEIDGRAHGRGTGQRDAFGEFPVHVEVRLLQITPGLQLLNALVEVVLEDTGREAVASALGESQPIRQRP